MSISYGDKALETLRSFIADVEREIAATPPSPALQEAWNGIVQTLALGPAPQYRECPACKQLGMRAASRCSRCWGALPALSPA